MKKIPSPRKVSPLNRVCVDHDRDRTQYPQYNAPNTTLRVILNAVVENVFGRGNEASASEKTECLKVLYRQNGVGCTDLRKYC